MPIIMGAS
jgi:pilus assembly protein Flp/PilA